MNQDKEKDQNFLPDGAKALLEGIHAIIIAFRQENNIPETRFTTDAGLSKNSLGVVEKEKYTKKGKRSTIDLFTMVKILNHYPNLKVRIGEYLVGDIEEKGTLVQIGAAVTGDPDQRIAITEQEIAELKLKADDHERRLARLEKKKPVLPG